MFVRQIFLDAGSHIINLAGLVRLRLFKDNKICIYYVNREDEIDLYYDSEEEAKQAFDLIKKQICRDPQVDRLE